MITEQLNPYVGLRPFQSDESLLFFGRNQQTAEILQRLHKNRFVAVVGGSGSGKSSLLRAGVIPKLKAGFLLEDSDDWCIVTMKPGRDPLYNLINAIYTEIRGNTPSLDEVNSILNNIKEEGVDYLIQFIEQHSKDPKINIFLLVDQFEELFRFSLYSDKHDDALEFVNLILEFSNQQQIAAYVVMTMRSDFIGDCSDFYGLPEALNNGQYLVPKMSRQELKLAIEGPAKLYGKAIDRRLLSRLLNDLHNVKDELPLLQHALMRMWEEEKSNNQNNILDLDDYNAVGTLKYALSKHAQLAYENLSNEDKVTAEIMFKALTTIDENGRKIRRPLLLSQILELSSASRDTILKIINKFIEGNRSFLMLQHLRDGEDINIDISHESLIRQWDTLNNWVEEEAEAASDYIQIAKAHKLKVDDKRGYLDSIELARANNWLSKNQLGESWASKYDYPYNDVIQYIKDSEANLASIEREKANKTKRIQRLMAGVIGLLIIILAAGTFYVITEAKKEAALVKENKAKMLYYQALLFEESDPTLSYGLLSEAIKIDDDSLYTTAQSTLMKEKSFYKNIGNLRQFGLKEFSVFQPFSIDESGSHLFIIDSSNTARLIDNTGMSIETFNEKAINASTFNKQGTTLYYTSGSNTIHSFDLSSSNRGSFEVPIEGDITTIKSLTDDRMLVGTNKGFVYKIDNQGNISYNERFKDNDNFNESNESIATAEATSNGRTYVIINSGRMAFLNTSGSTLDLAKNRKYTVADISDDGIIVIGSADGLIQTMTFEGQISSIFKADETSVKYLSFVGGGNFILSSSEHGVIHLWSREGNLIQTFIGHDKPIFAHSISEDGSYLSTFSLDGTFKRWKLKSSIKGIKTVNMNVTSAEIQTKNLRVSIFDESNLLTNAISKNGIEAINIKNGQVETKVSTLSSCNDITKDFRLSPDNKKVLVFCDNGNLSVYDIASNDKLLDLGDVGLIKGMGFTGDSSAIYTASLAGTINIYAIDEPNIGNLIDTINLGSAISSLNTIPGSDEELIVALELKGVSRVNIESRSIEPVLRSNDFYITALCISTDQSKLAIGTNSGDVLVYDIKDQTYRLKREKLHQKKVIDLQFSKDGNYILSISQDRITFLNSIDSYGLLAIKDGSLPILAVIFLDDSNIMSLSGQGVLKYWPYGNEDNVMSIGDDEIESLSKELKEQFEIFD